MPRVVHVAQPTDGGAAAVVARVAADQARRGWEVSVACPAGEPLAGALAAAGVRRLAWAATRSPGPATLGEAVRLRRLLRQERPDLVHLHSSKAGLAGRLVLRGRVPTLFQPHGWSWLAVGGPVAAATRAWERRAARWSARVVCVSAGERAAGEAAGVRARYAVVHNGVDRRRFAVADAADRRAARAALDLPAGPLAVCVGRFTPAKGQDLLLQAWPQVRARVPDAVVAFVGPDAPAAPAAGVVFAGERSDVRSWLAAADVVVVPSRWDGLSLALLEAAAVGCSIVATDVSGVREVLGDGERGAVVPVDAAAVAAAVVRRLLDPSLVAAERAAAAEVAGRFDEQATFQRLADLVDEVLAAPIKAP